MRPQAVDDSHVSSEKYNAGMSRDGSIGNLNGHEVKLYGYIISIVPDIKYSQIFVPISGLDTLHKHENLLHSIQQLRYNQFRH